MAIYHTDTTIVNYAVGEAGNGLFYDQNNRIDYFGDAQTYCTSIGMRLPTQANNETDVFSSYNAYNSNGVPNTGIIDYQGTYMNWSSTSSNSYTGQNTIWCYGKYYWVAEVGLNVRLSYRCIK